MRTGRRLEATRRNSRPRLPTLLFFTDPGRTPDAGAVLRTLPRGAGVVFRAFGADAALADGQALARIARRRRLTFLVGADHRLALALGADGVHLPERLAWRAGALKRARPGWIVTVAAHSRMATDRARRAGADAVVVSPVFASRSASAGAPMGVTRFAALIRDAGLPVYALGGVTGANASRAIAAGARGIAAVEAFALEAPAQARI
ncbi:MAG: thiamine phosphate synthase [Caulobacterales bacterium]